MPIPTTAIGTALPPVTADIERGRLRLFAKATGENRAIYTDVDAARASGHPDLPVPPTLLFGLELEQADPFWYLRELGVDLRRVLHGEQSFTYHTTAHAGETLTAHPRITDVYSRKNGTLEFLVKETTVTRSGVSLVADLRTILVVQNPEATS